MITMMNSLLVIILAFLMQIQSQQSLCAASKQLTFNILDYGAKANDMTFNNAPIFRKVVQLCEQEQKEYITRKIGTQSRASSPISATSSASASSTANKPIISNTPNTSIISNIFCNVIVPSGIFMTSPFNVTSNMMLKILENGMIIGSDNIDDFPLLAVFPSYGRGREIDNQARYSSLISGFGIENFTLEGPGTIDGNGMVWWKKRIDKSLQYTRGRLIEFLWSENITIRNITLKNSPFWTIHPIYSKNILIEFVHINNPVISPNTDGIDPDSCENVIIRYNTITAGDDNISIKSGWNEAGLQYGKPSRNIEIYKNNLFLGDGIAIGSEMSGGVENIHIHDNVYSATVNAVRLKTGYGRGGYIRNVTWENEVLDGVATCVYFNMYYSKDSGKRNETLVPKLRNISLLNLSGVCAQAGHFACLSGTGYCQLDDMENIHIASAKSWQCENVVVNNIEDVHPGMCKN